MAAALSIAGAASIDTLPGVFRGRELTRKERRLRTALAPINALLEGGIPRGRISEIVGRRSSGKTSLAAAFISAATRHGEVAAVIDLANAFDPSTMAEAGVDLSRVLWAAVPASNAVWERATEDLQSSSYFRGAKTRVDNSMRSFLRAAEMVLEAGGFGLLVMDFGDRGFTLPSSSALRLARMAERSGTAVLVVAPRPVCGTFAALSLELASMRRLFIRRIRWARPGPKHYLKDLRQPHPRPVPRTMAGEATAAALFEGMEIRATLRRNKLGRCGQSAQWRSLVSLSESYPWERARTSDRFGVHARVFKLDEARDADAGTFQAQHLP